MRWQPDRQSALNRLAAFMPLAGHQYSRNRNTDLGKFSDNHVSGLSPWLRCGVISELEVLEATLRQHSSSAAEKFIMEVFWRAYFKGWLEHRPQVWRDYQFQLTGLLVDYQNNQDYLRAIGGNTGINCFDAWVSELVQTGYLHNHSRMWFASIWIFTLKLPWQLGASFFMQHLLDGDPAANTLSWRWVAGLHTRGKTYLARPDNISRYTGGRFDPITGLARHAEALIEEQDYQKSPLSLHSAPTTTPNLLLITDECCHAEKILSLDKTQVIFGLIGTAGNVSAQVHEWYLAVYADAYEWVELPNTIGMSQFADGGVVGSKPYAASGNYINKMSDYCKNCRYDVKQKYGESACPFNYLYWDFLNRNRDKLGKNNRLFHPFRTWDRMDEARQRQYLDSAAIFLERLD